MKKINKFNVKANKSKIKYVNLISYFLFLVNFLFIAYADCVDGAKVWNVIFSLNDSTFSKDYNGTAGIIERIYFNTSSNKYELWQTNLLPINTTYPWGGLMPNHYYYPSSLMVD